jgi:hypothetical protein
MAGSPVVSDSRPTSLRALVPDDLSHAQQVRAVAYGLIGLHLMLKAWVLLPAWFYSDDFIFLEDALKHRLTPDFLFTSHDSQLMPLGVAISWVVAHAGPYNWLLAGSITLLLQALAAVSCLAMLRTLFGDRWAILAPLGFFLFTAMGIEAMTWWAAALNAVPIQIAFFLLVTCVVRWARERRARWALGAGVALTLAVASGPRGMVMVVPVGLLLLLFFTPGRWWFRPWQLVRTHALLIAPLVVVGAAYLVVYASSTPSPVEAQGSAPAMAIGRNLVGTSWLTSLVGGPWRWDEYNPPMSHPDPPAALYALAGLAVLSLVMMSVRRGARVALAAIAILVAQLAVTYLALVYGRGLQLGASAGLMTRYLTDTLPVTALVFGLLMLPIAGTTITSRSVSVRGRWRPFAVATTAVFLAGSVVSTVAYASAWHRDYPAREFVANAHSSLAAEPAVIAELEVPDQVQARLSYPHNLPSRLLYPLGKEIDTTYRGNDIRILDDHGVHQQAAVFPSATSRPGPVRDCGYTVKDRAARIRLDKTVANPFWWMSIGYLSSGDGKLEVHLDGKKAPDIRVQNGLHTYFMRSEGPLTTIELRSLTDNVTVCVDTVRVGDLVPVS